MYSSTITQYEERAPEPRVEPDQPMEIKDVPRRQLQPFIYRNIIVLAILHVVAFYTLFFHSLEAKLYTWLLSPFWGYTGGLGITAGAHRLWAHRSYSAKLPLRIFLAFIYCMAGQTHLSKWIRDHRTHHRYTETPADPHDANRGFFFSHIGWLMMKRHPAVKQYGSKIDMSDIKADPVIQFFDKYYIPIMILLTFVIPTLIPVYCWNETWRLSIYAVIIRYVWLLNVTFFVNSFAHMWGNRPYNSSLRPTENPTVSFFTLGEGWHNYHHSFPWDYKAAELGNFSLNGSAAFINLMAKTGLAYDLKSPSKELVEKTALKKGDGTQSLWGTKFEHKKY
ncbi:acyl-CoA Delta-9 desaturase-like [Prorops nasuta]|uniref:acyl-CoA Delta-9 desaturase-like n=1 Tax=Prorops nasuta TaxID=863751 RepID=UPI0034CFF8E9